MEKNLLSEETCGINKELAFAILGGVEKNAEKSIDIQKETEQILSMTPKDGYQKKIELIANAKDLSTQEKIKAIDDAEDKYTSDLKKNAEICSGLMWVKTGAILTCTAGIVLMVFSPQGRKMAQQIINKFT